MPDHFTACLATDEATLKAILTAAPYNHTYIETFAPFTKGDLRFNVYDSGGAPTIVGAVTAAGNKVIVHTQS